MAELGCAHVCALQKPVQKKIYHGGNTNRSHFRPFSAGGKRIKALGEQADRLFPRIYIRLPFIIFLFFRGRTQPYHHMVVVIDAQDWDKKGLLVLKFDKVKTWTDGDGELGSSDFSALQMRCPSCTSTTMV